MTCVYQVSSHLPLSLFPETVKIEFYNWYLFSFLSFSILLSLYFNYYVAKKVSSTSTSTTTVTTTTSTTTMAPPVTVRRMISTSSNLSPSTNQNSHPDHHPSTPFLSSITPSTSTTSRIPETPSSKATSPQPPFKKQTSTSSTRKPIITTTRRSLTKPFDNEIADSSSVRSGSKASARLNTGGIIALSIFGGFVFLAAIITILVIIVRR